MSVTSKTERANQLLASRLGVPEHVVYRNFGHETIVLSLADGKYYGVNATGGRMLETLEQVSSVSEAAALLAHEYDRDLSEVEDDLVEFCERLVDCGLLVVEPA
jgi:hypothetical protein